MNKAHMDQVFSDFIERGDERLSPKKFFQVLQEAETSRVDETIELSARVVGDQLCFEPSPEVSVHDNEIVVGAQRLIVRLV